MPVVWDHNLVEETETFVTHLECSMTGERSEPDVVHGLSAAGYPLLVRYDLIKAREKMSLASLGARHSTCGATARSCRSAVRRIW